MLDFLRDNPLVTEAKKARLRPRSMLLHLILFFAVMTVTDIAAVVPVSVYAMIRVMGTLPPDIFLGDTMDTEAAIGAIEEATAALSGDDGYLLVTLFSYLLSGLLIVVFCRFVEGRPLASMGLASVRRPVLHYAVGLGVGAAAFALAFLVLLATGALTAVGGSFSISMLFAYLGGFLIYGAAQELLLHGYLMVSLTGITRPLGAVIYSSLFFALLQVYSGGFSLLSFLNSFLFGTLLGLITFRFCSLYAAMALRGAWYFAQLVLFGCSEAGAAPTHRVLSVVLTAGRDMTHGGAYGVDGGAAVTVVLILAIGALLLLPAPQRTAPPENGDVM